MKLVTLLAISKELFDKRGFPRIITTMHYNMDLALWQSFRRAYPFSSIVIIKGLLYCAPHGMVTERQPRACFPSSEKAAKVLIEAGYEQTGFGESPVFTSKEPEKVV